MIRSVLENEDKFLEIVQTTPDLLEADGMIRDALAGIKLEMAEAALMQSVAGNARMTQLGALKDKLRSELHRIQTIQNTAKWSEAVKAVAGIDVYEECVTWIRAHDGLIG